MEKVKIVSVTGATSKGGKTYFKISLEDGRKGTSFDEKFLALQGKDANVEIVKNGEYLNMSLPKEEEKKAEPQPGNVKLEVAKVVLSNPSIPTDQYLNICDSIYKWIITE